MMQDYSLIKKTFEKYLISFIIISFSLIMMFYFYYDYYSFFNAILKNFYDFILKGFDFLKLVMAELWEYAFILEIIGVSMVLWMIISLFI
jgi:hypothetical protein